MFSVQGVNLKNMDIQKAQNIYQTLSENIQEVIKGKQEMIRKLLAAFLSGGHVLLEDVPGTGKTTLAKALAKSIGTSYKRLQFTPDLLPSDILGVSIYNKNDGTFNFNKGPVFTNILLADEINRASPRTQSALLEAMAEKQISTEGTRYALDRLFFVIATENPVESHGTYPLPESQMDRFMVKLTPGYLDRDIEVSVITDQLEQHPLERTRTVVTENDIFMVMDVVRPIKISEEIRYYIVDLVGATRNAEHVLLGASPRASLALMKISQAFALFEGRDFVVPEDVQEAAEAVIAHRLQLQPQAKFQGVTPESVVKAIINSIPVPK
jgi:MoxR-like ATPase